tara:strand:+ start:137 stop:367 length:231 start_codon:yes stop_codon:yes gene_type:complete
MNTETVVEITDQLKTLNNLNFMEFEELLFPGSMAYYVQGKWELFQKDKLRFIWSCSVDKIELMVQYINEQNNLTND